MHIIYVYDLSLGKHQDGERGVLLFTATMTVVRNGRIREVPFDTRTEVSEPSDRQGIPLLTASTAAAFARGAGARKVFVLCWSTRFFDVKSLELVWWKLVPSSRRVVSRVRFPARITF